MLFKTFVTLLAASATATAIANTQGGHSDGSTDIQHSGGQGQGGKQNSHDGGHDQGHGGDKDKNQGKTKDNDYDEDNQDNDDGDDGHGGGGNYGGYPSPSSTRGHGGAQCTGRGFTSTKTITHTSTIRDNNWNGGATSSPQSLSVILYRRENCQVDRVTREGNIVNHDVYNIALPNGRSGRANDGSQSSCINASNGRDFESLSFLGSGGSSLTGCRIVAYDQSNCRGDTREIELRGNERECYNTQDGDDDDNDNDNDNRSGNGQGEWDENDDDNNNNDDDNNNDNEGAQSFRVTCNR